VRRLVIDAGYEESVHVPDRDIHGRQRTKWWLSAPLWRLALHDHPRTLPEVLTSLLLLDDINEGDP